MQLIPFQDGIRLGEGARSARALEMMPGPLLRLLTELHHRFEPERQELLKRRAIRQAEWDRGGLPGYCEERRAHGDWRVAPIPRDLQRRRVEITGPASSAKMVIQMLSRTADGEIADTAMIDFEDSMKPSWRNVVDALHNVAGVARGELVAESGDKVYRLNPDDMAHPMIRVRGLHLDESNVRVDGECLSAGLFDLAACAYHTAAELLARGKTPTYYVPKTEHYCEARWWNELFRAVEEGLGLPSDTLRVTFLIETLPAAFQMEEILYEIRERALGLNGGRWDKIFSDIKVLRNHADRVLADRGSITMETPWMANYAQRLIKICHRHGAFAMGGMAAFTPGKDPATRERQVEKVRADKAREAAIGHDGCWISHPYFIGVAKSQFTRDNQLDVRREDFPDRPDLLPRADGPKTLAGLRTNIRVGIAYLHGWNADIGCVAFDNLMEDLATLEISRAQTWQWLHHGVRLDDGTRVTRALIDKLFAEEGARIREELPGDDAGWRRAEGDALAIFLREELSDFLCDASPEMAAPAERNGGDAWGPNQRLYA